MSALSLIHRGLLIGILGVGVTAPATAEPYVHGSLGVGDAHSTQWGIGAGIDVDESPWGGEVNLSASDGITKGDNELKQKWISLSATYRITPFFLKDATLKAGLGLASIYRHTNNDEFNNNDFLWTVTPNVELSYRLGQHWDAFVGYRYFFDDSRFGSHFSSNVFTLGARLYWARSEPVISILNDDQMTPTMMTLRHATLSQSNALESTLDGYGLSPEFNQFFVQNAQLSTAWDTLTVVIDDKETFDIPLSEQVGRLNQRLPKGLHTLTFTLKGKEPATGELKTVEVSRSIRLYRTQGMNFSLSVEHHFMGDVLDVQAF